MYIIIIGRKIIEFFFHGKAWERWKKAVSELVTKLFFSLSKPGEIEHIVIKIQVSVNIIQVKPFLFCFGFEEEKKKLGYDIY